MSDLPRRQQQLHDLLFGKGDVSITDIFASMRTDETPAYDDVRQQQRWLGPYVSALNRTLADKALRVEPGALKQTYRLVVLTTTT